LLMTRYRLSEYRKLIVLLMDILIMGMVSVTLFLLSPLGNGTGGRDLEPLFINLGIWLSCIIIFQVMFRTYDSLWRYAESREYILLLMGFFCGTGLFLLMTTFLFPRRLAGLYMVAVMGSSLMAMLFVRFLYRAYRREKSAGGAKAQEDQRRYLAIIGAGSAGVALMEEIERKYDNPYRVWGFFDDDLAKIGHRIRGVEVKGPISSLPELVKKSPVYDVVLAIPSLPLERRQEIFSICSKLQCRLKILPDMLVAMDRGEFSYSGAMRDMRIEDLLSRTSVQFDCTELEPFLHGKTILVTGAGGSIGSELCRQVAAYQPRRLVLLDAFENQVYELREELKHLFPANQDIFIEIASVRDPRRLENVLAEHRPHIIFHAAAHKHVPLMEAVPDEAIKNNIFGTYNLMNLAVKYGCAKFVQISTDKAVNPTNVMGATKRFCEMMVQAMAARYQGVTEFVAVRFGNVLGSSGSVIPLFKAQIEHGGPVTVTDRRITRYFMTIPEAASLVLQAGAMARRSEVFVLDMGQPVNIWELAEKMIALSGFRPYVDIEIKEVGLRPGEKLYEELLINKERHFATAHERIFVEAQAQRYDLKFIDAALDRLSQALNNNDQRQMVALLKEFVPAFHAPEEVNESGPEELADRKVERYLRDQARAAEAQAHQPA